MNFSKRLCFWIGSIALFSLGYMQPLLANDFQGEDGFFDVSGAWRKDHLRSFTKVVDSLATDTIKADELNIYQIGFITRYAPCFDPCNCLGWLNGAFIKGSSYWGWANNGEYLHDIVYDPDDIESTFQEDLVKGDIHSGTTLDYTIGVGYYFTICNWFRIGPTAGYSYHRLRFKGTNMLGTRTIDFEDDIIGQEFISEVNPFTFQDNGVQFNSRWTGPWLGAELNYNLCDLNIYGGYEYHWAQWKGEFDLKQPDIQDCYHYSDKRHGNKGFGHEVYVDACYDICDCWNVGLGLSYKYYHIETRGFEPKAGADAVGCDPDEIHKVNTTWHTFAVSLDVGFNF